MRVEDSLTYNEPPDWPFPTRHYLGAELLAAGVEIRRFGGGLLHAKAVLIANFIPLQKPDGGPKLRCCMIFCR